MERACADLSARLKKDGLDIDIQKIEKRKYQYELVWKEKNTAEKIIAEILNLMTSQYEESSKDRYVYRVKRDEYRFDLGMVLTW